MKECTFQKVIYQANLIFILVLFSGFGLTAQKLDVAYVPTPDSVVERMLDMADVGPGDYVIDLGCGDGRIVIEAAKRGAFGHGVDLDPQRIEEARKNAQRARVADKVIFVEQNIFDTDFSRANVIAMYLFPSINRKLRPSLLEKLKPGSRIVSHDFGMDEWRPDQQHGRLDNHAVLLWIVPDKVEGTWNWNLAGNEFNMKINQKFQKVKIYLTSEDRILKVEDSLLSGKRISFVAYDNLDSTKFIFSGQVEHGKIEGIVQIHNGRTKWVDNWTAFLK